MEEYDPRIDAYIKKSAEFAKPILRHIRKLAHQASPDVRETVKWGFPHFDCRGTLCSMASFKEHCTFGFWKTALLTDPYQVLKKEEANAMGQFGRIKSISDLPADTVLISYIKEAVVLNEKNVKVPKSTPPKETATETPAYFLKVLSDHPIAKSHFENFSNSHRKEYIEWIVDAKTDETRSRRIKTALEWITEGKGKNWKYERKNK